MICTASKIIRHEGASCLKCYEYAMVKQALTADLGLTDDAGTDDRKTPLSTHQITDAFTHNNLVRFLPSTLLSELLITVPYRTILTSYISYS